MLARSDTDQEATLTEMCVFLGPPKIGRVPDTEVDESKPGKKSVNEMLAEMRLGDTGKEAAEAASQ